MCRGEEGRLVVGGYSELDLKTWSTCVIYFSFFNLLNIIKIRRQMDELRQTFDPVNHKWIRRCRECKAENSHVHFLNALIPPNTDRKLLSEEMTATSFSDERWKPRCSCHVLAFSVIQLWWDRGGKAPDEEQAVICIYQCFWACI